METIGHDLRHALRLLRRSPGFTSVSVLTLALAIGATTAIFSVVYGVLLRPLPYSDPGRIMAIFEVNTRGTWSRLADPNFDDFRDQNHTFQSVAKYSANIASVSGGSQPTAEISTIARRIHDTSNEQRDYLLKDAAVVPLHESITHDTRPALLILLGAVGFLLLVACANVANLLLAQASVRERELAVRSALGAARSRLILQFLSESFLLALISCALGTLGAYLGISGLLALAPANLPRLNSVSINFPVLLFALLLSSAVAIGLGAFTAIRATSGNVREALGEGGRSQAGSP